MSAVPVFEAGRSTWFLRKLTGIVEVTEAGMKHAVCIDSCDGVTVIIKNKVKNVQILSCKNTQVVVESALSGVEITDSTKVKVQAIQEVPSFAIDKTVGVTIYLSKESLGAEFVTSRSGEMNVVIPKGEDDSMELPLPEQFVHKIKDGKITSEVSALY
eukprot:GEMP01041863.1.p1 GENE.GEMP01041863.1~~GEMP01041863.1.p1  ORF type:complete len:158 (+),score=30.45 GEMP01041863.1:76-549(+)